MKLAKRITQSSKKSFGMYEASRQLPGDNSDLIHLELGSPHADTPDAIKEATIQALRAGDVHYSDLRGLQPLRAALAGKLRANNGLDVQADDILVTNGLTQGSYNAFMALLDDGDEVIMLAPYYPQHVGKIELAGGRVVLADLDAQNDFRIDAANIEARVSARTRAIVLVNPANPTGRVYERSELEALAQIAIKYDLVVISDEVYEDIVYDGARHISIASLPGMAARTISLFAFTKSYAMDGWRVGYLCAAPELVQAMLKVSANTITHVNTFVQAGALAAIQGGEEVIAGLIAEDAAKREIVVTRLNAMRGVRCTAPAGAIYAFADIRGTGLSSQALADRLMTEARVVVEAGSFYGAAGEGYIRVCFGSESHANIVTAMARLAAFFEGL